MNNQPVPTEPTQPLPAVSITVQPTQACHVRIGDVVQGTLINTVVTNIEPGAFGGLKFTVVRADGHPTTNPMVHTVGKTQMVNVIVAVA